MLAKEKMGKPAQSMDGLTDDRPQILACQRPPLLPYWLPCC